MNEILLPMARDLSRQHRNTVVYSPWVNRTVERLNRDIFAAFCAMLAVLKLAPHDRTGTIDMRPSILNQTPKQRYGRN